MAKGFILAIDQGTTNTKALLVDATGEPVFRVSAPVSLIHSKQGLVEQDPMLLWDSVVKATAECVAHAGAAGVAIEAVAISNQRETAVAWDASTGKPIANAVSWQCGRAAGICDRLAPYATEFRGITGLPLAPLVSAGKWGWLLENNATVQSLGREERLRFGTVDSWLMHQLTKGAAHVTDLSNASRTGLLNLRNLHWDSGLLETFSIPASAMPVLKPSAGLFGECAAIPELEGVPVLAAIGDSHAAMFGHGRYGCGTVKATYGTGSSLMALTEALPEDTPILARTIAWSIDGAVQYALEGNIPMTGSGVQWVGEFLQLANAADETAQLAETVESAAGVYFVPAMVGLGAPYWDAQARGTITGLGRAHTSAHLARAAVDAIAYQVADVFFAMEHAMGSRLPNLYADGGATRNKTLMQFQADILGRTVLRSRNEELSAIGAARLAGLTLGWWSGLAEMESLSKCEDSFSPSMTDAEREALGRGWKDAVRRTRVAPEAAR
jgi:glycerol kinase